MHAHAHKHNMHLTSFTVYKNIGTSEGIWGIGSKCQSFGIIVQSPYGAYFFAGSSTSQITVFEYIMGQPFNYLPLQIQDGKKSNKSTVREFTYQSLLLVNHIL